MWSFTIPPAERKYLDLPGHNIILLYRIINYNDVPIKIEWRRVQESANLPLIDNDY